MYDIATHKINMEKAMSAEIEREIKFRAPDAIEAKIQELGYEKVKVIRQVDDYYIVNKLVGSGQHYLRIRQPSDPSSLASLDYHVATSDIDTQETEVKIQDAGKVQDILGLLGYPLVCTVDKNRTIYKTSEVELTVDRIASLGTFVEIEAKSDAVSIDALFRMANDLGLREEDRIINVGYPDLVLENNHIDALRPPQVGGSPAKAEEVKPPS